MLPATILVVVAAASTSASPPVPPAQPPARFIIPDSTDGAIYSTCSGHANYPCAMRYVRELVDTVISDLESAETQNRLSATLADVSSGEYNEGFYFWPSVFNESGYYVACGREADGDGVQAGRYLAGEALEDVALAEIGMPQAGLWDRITAAASGDGFFLHLALDTYAGHERNFHEAATDAVPRIGYVRATSQVGQGGGQRFYVVSSFTDMPVSVSYTTCDWHYDGQCSIDYVNRIVGTVSSRMLRAVDEAELEQVLYSVTAREFNEQATSDGTVETDAGFYPFVITFDGTYTGHGADPALIGLNVSAVVASVPHLAGVTSPQLNDEMVAAARAGGRWVAYMWRNDPATEIYPKISFVVGVNRFGTDYYVGAGFNHVQTPLVRGPHCASCRLGHNYPCAYANTLSLFSHAQTLMLMSNWYARQVAFNILTNDQSHGGGGAAYRDNPDDSADWLYVFAFDFNGTCVAHGANAALVGRTLVDIVNSSEALSPVVDGQQLHQEFKTMAKAGGGWVSYTWRNDGDEHAYSKLAYVQRIRNGGRTYYFGVGMGDVDWTERLVALEAVGGGTSRWGWGCSLDAQHPCSEDWALAIAGHRLSSLLHAKTHEELMATFDNATSIAQFGFEAHVQNSTHVLYDGHDPSFAGDTRASWLHKVGLTEADLEGHDPTGSWLGPFQMRLVRDGHLSYRYLFALSVPVSDVVADGIVNGISDMYTILVAVSAISGTSGMPMKTVVPPEAPSTAGLWCLSRPAMIDLTRVGAEDYVKCVSNWDAISEHEEAYCEVNQICERSTNKWASGDYTDDLSCVEVVAAANTTAALTTASFCGCNDEHEVRFASPRLLGGSSIRLSNASERVDEDSAGLPADAQCAAAEYQCELGDTSCENRMQLQLTYEQFCQLADEPDAPRESQQLLLWFLVSGFVVFMLCMLSMFQWYRIKSRRKQLRFVSTGIDVSRGVDFSGGYVTVPPVSKVDFAHLPGLEDSRCFHLFLSHAWPLGQSVCHLIKQRCHEMCPSVKCFLDVDDLQSGSGTNEVDHTKEILVFAMPVYFQKFNCVKELFRAFVRQKPITLLLPDAEIHGAFTQDMIREIVTDEWIAKWKLDEKLAVWAKEWGVESIPLPTAAELCDALFAQPPLEWSRIPVFQNETMKLIIQRLLPAKMKKYDVHLASDPSFSYASSNIISKGKLGTQHDPVKVYCSPHNVGAAALATEVVTRWPGLLVMKETDLSTCDHVLVYLNANTWTEERAQSLAADIAEAQKLGIHLQLCHEFPSLLDQGSARAAAEFKSIMDATPENLKNGNSNIYKQIAISLKCHEWRKVGMVRIAQALARLHPRVPIEADEPSDQKTGTRRGTVQGTMRGMLGTQQGLLARVGSQVAGLTRGETQKASKLSRRSSDRSVRV